MRLIDADDFFNRMNNDTDLCAEMEFEGFKALKKYLDLQPTAYSVDKVVDELNELDLKSITRYNDENFGDFDGVEYYIKKRKAIEIVKRGGVSDDVCEWRQTSTARYKTRCGYKLEEYFDTKACYCKQCGKRIKIVE